MAKRGKAPRAQVFSIYYPSEAVANSAAMKAFEKLVGEFLANPAAMEDAMNAPRDKPRLFVDGRGNRLFILENGSTIYRPEDWDKL